MEKAILLGLGFDCKDGLKRITLSKNYRLYGGSRETHRLMQEKCVKLNEQLKKRGKSLDEISADEFYEMAYKVGLKNTNNKKRF